MRQTVLFLLVGFLCGTTVPLQAQPGEPPYEQWIDMLSVKQDEGYLLLRSVIVELREVDSSQYCNTFRTLQSKASTRNPRLQTRLKILTYKVNLQGVGFPVCHPGQEPVQFLLDALTDAYELEDDLLTFQIYNELVAYYTARDFRGEAVLYGTLGKEMYERYGRDKMYPMAAMLHHLGVSLYHSREYQAAIDVLTKYLSHKHDGYLSRTDTISTDYDMFAWNALGLSYLKSGSPDAARIAFDSAFLIAEKGQLAFWKAIIKGNQGDVYFQLGQYDSAAVLLQYDYEGSMASNELDNAANSLQWLARIDLIRNRPAAALDKAREALGLLRSKHYPVYKANTLYTLSKIFAQTGPPDSIAYYMDQYITLHDSIEQRASDSRAENVLMRLEGQENIYTIKVLNNEKRRVALIRNFTLALIILTALFGLMILNRQKLKLKVRRQEALEAARLAEHEAKLAKEQLNQFTRSLLEKTALVETLQEQLLEREMSEEQKAQFAALSRHVILTDEDWESFKVLFEKVYPGFFFALKQRVTDLTMADQRVAAMSRLQVSNKEASALLGIAPNSVSKARQRLRHRLGLDQEADLEAYFASKDFN